MRFRRVQLVICIALPACLDDVQILSEMVDVWYVGMIIVDRNIRASGSKWDQTSVEILRTKTCRPSIESGKCKLKRSVVDRYYLTWEIANSSAGAESAPTFYICPQAPAQRQQGPCWYHPRATPFPIYRRMRGLSVARVHNIGAVGSQSKRLRMFDHRSFY